MLSGWKTYIIGGISIIYGIVLYVQGNSEQAGRVILDGLGLIFLRAGVSKVGT